MNITSITFTDPPINHQYPAIYENLGLPQVASFIEQRFEFTYRLGKIERTAYGSIRLYKHHLDYKIIIQEKLPGVGPVRLETLKRLLLKQLKLVFIQNIKSVPHIRTVYYTDFRRIAKNDD